MRLEGRQSQDFTSDQGVNQWTVNFQKGNIPVWTISMGINWNNMGINVTSWELLENSWKSIICQ